MTRRMVVVGGDAAGMSAAARARRLLGPDELEVLAFERGPRTSYAACGLPYHVQGLVADPEDLVARTPEQFAAAGITALVHHEVVAIDTSARIVDVHDLRTGSTLTESWDELVVATGATALRPDLPGIDTDGVQHLRTIDDAVALDRRIEQGATRAVVVGAGYVGVEVAEALLARGLSVTVVDAAERPLAATLDPPMAALVDERMRSKGVDLRLSCAVEGFEGAAGALRAVATSAGTVEADVAVLGLGVRPATHLAIDAGIPAGDTGGLVVDDRMHTPVDGVWAAGDCVESRHRVTGRSVVVALGTHANKQGRVVGSNLGGGDARFPGVLGTAVTKFCELEIGRTGLGAEEARELWDVEVGSVTSRTRARYYPGTQPAEVQVVYRRDDGVLLGAQVVGGPGTAKRIDAFAVAIWNGMAVEDLAMADLSYAPPFSPVWDPVVRAAAVVGGARLG